MRKIYLIIICFFIGIYNINAQDKYKVTLYKCVDGDTAWFKKDEKIIKTRFLAIDTPESTKEIEPYGKEASTYSCDRLKNSNNIEIEYDKKSDKLDKYGRHLVWVFVDNSLLQKELIDKGLAEVKYIYGDYLYLDELKKSEEKAKFNKLNIWDDENSLDSLLYNTIFFVLIVGVVVIFKPNKKVTKKLIKEYKKRMKWIILFYFNNLLYLFFISFLSNTTFVVITNINTITINIPYTI